MFVGFERFPGGGIEVAPANVHGWRPEERERERVGEEEVVGYFLTVW